MKFNRCFGCMEEIQGYPCPHCGFDPRSVKGIEYALPMGTILAGKYLVGRVLGQGGFGITYVGWDIALERKVAIKEYYPSGQVSRNPGSRGLTWYTSVQSQQAKQNGTQIFLKEARKMSKVDDIPNVVRVRDLFQENETAYIVMDFVEGETLKARLEKTGPLPWEQAKGIFLPAIQAMEQVHQAGLVHRDISPDNLMLTPDGKVKILDLGAAKDLSVNNGASSMQVAKGGFSPFEQYTQRGSSGPWTDVYAMAATVYYTLTGKLPPVATDRVVEDTISWEEPGLKALSAQALEALQKAMVISAKNRMQSMEELEKGLYSTAVEPAPTPVPQPVQETRPEPQPAPGTRPAPEETKPELKPTPEPAPQAKPEAGKKSGKKLWIATAAVIAVVLCGALVWANAAKPVNDDKQAQVLTNETKYSEPTTAATTTATAAPTAAMPVSIPFSAEIGSTVEFGHYEQNGNSADGPEPIEWYVLSKDENANTLLLLSVYGLDNVQYHKENKDITWAECDLREWLNSESGFWGTAFSGEEKERIESTLCKTPAMDFPGCQTVGGDDTVDKIFLLSLDEFWDNGIGDKDEWRNVSPTPYALSQGAEKDEWGYYLWWLRTPGAEQNVVCDGRTGGARSSSLVNTSQLLRPALWVVADDADPAQETTQEIKPTSWVEGTWTWSLENGVLTISGEGNMGNFGFGDSPWYSQRAAITRVVVEEGITGIGVYAFGDCRNISSVSFPHSLRYIRECAFWFNDRLKTVDIPEGVTYIGGSAFHQCEALESISIPSTLAVLDDNPFIYCYALTQIKISQDNSCFKVVDGALFSKDMKTLFCYLPKNGSSPYIIPDGVERIEQSAFCGCTELTSVIIPESVTSIGSNAFVYCSGLTSASIPKSVNLIEGAAFFCCDNLTDIYYAGDESQWNRLTGNGQADIPNGCTIHYNHNVQ